MKKQIVSIIIYLIAGFTVYSQAAYIDFLEGDVFIRDKKGKMAEAFVDDELDIGDTIISGKNGSAEIYFGDTLIRLMPKTVFQLLDSSKADKKSNIFSCISGSIFLKIEKLSGDQLDMQINTPSANCGVRGTAFTVFAGVDGSSLIAVEEGLVAVESNGKTVELSPDEGVEVKPGEEPGDKFPVLKGKLDYSEWSDQKLDDFLADPLLSAERVQNRLSGFIEKLNIAYKAYLENSERVDKERATYKAMSKDKAEEKKVFYKEVIFPLEIETTNLFRNVRYYTLSSLSLRRYVAGRMYIIMKTLFIENPDTQEYRNFLAIYEAIIASFEKEIVPHLVEADI